MEEPAFSFNDAALKVEWAKVLLGHVETWTTDFVQSKPYTVSLIDYPQTGERRMHIGLSRPIPPKIPLILGDICGNLRSALDFCWMGLVRSHVGSKAAKKTMPIGSNREALISTIEQAPIGGAIERAKSLLVDRIGSHRDFANGGNPSLAALNDLSNWNKHNLIVTSIGVTELRDYHLGEVDLSGLKVEGDVRGVINFAPDVIARFGDTLKPTYQRDPIVEIVFGPHKLVEREPILSTTINLAEFALGSVMAFCEAFPSSENPRLK